MTVFNPQNIKISDFDYPLPDERIASHPLARRDQCKLLFLDKDREIRDYIFSSLPELLLDKTDSRSPGMMVFNNTRVIHARMQFQRQTGANIEVFLLEPLNPQDYVLVFQTRGECEWSCMVGNLKKWKDDFLERTLIMEDGSSVILRACLGQPCGGNARRIRFTWDDPQVNFASIIESAGNIPIPPYLKRDSESSDETDYQTVYGKIKGSVAAPTAGLHFTDEILSRLASGGMELQEVTLHVGAGTFQPVKSEEIGDHPMHTESFSVSENFLRELAVQVEEQNLGVRQPVTAVGTTSVRTLETLPYLGRHAQRLLKEGREGNLHMSQWEAYSEPAVATEVPGYLRALADFAAKQGGTLQASTAIMIAPGFKWNIVGRMVTNFHQPSSTLLLLVSSFMEPYNNDSANESPLWKKVYGHALEADYRFLSYGDANLLIGGTSIVNHNL